MFYARFEWEEPEGSKIRQLIEKIGAENITNKSSRITIKKEPFDNDVRLRENALFIRVEIPILEDFTFDIQSNFQDIKDVLTEIPLLGKILDLFQTLNKLSATGSGRVSEGSEYMKFQTWAETEPFKMAIRGVLETKTSSYFDSYLPALMLYNQTVISVVTNKSGVSSLFVPGINLKDVQYIKEMRANDKKNGPGASNTNSQNTTKPSDDKQQDQIINTIKSGSNKVLKRFEIVTKDVNGKDIRFLSISPCFIQAAKPTWSKEQTTVGLPLWCELELQIQSVYSASDTMFSFDTFGNESVGGSLRPGISAAGVPRSGQESGSFASAKSTFR